MAEANEILLQAKGLTKVFSTGRKGQVVHAVSQVDLTIYRGETLALVGESGCGKSTLGRTLIRMLPATAGQVLFCGQDITAMNDKQFRPLRRRLQMVFQWASRRSSSTVTPTSFPAGSGSASALPGPLPCSPT